MIKYDISYPFTEEEKKYPSSCHSGRKCEKCNNKAFYISSGRDYIRFICSKCKHEFYWDLPEYE
jgi:hypothetical protein